MKLFKGEHLLISNVIEAKSFVQRLFGLIFYKSLDSDSAMLFRNCGSIHTFHMNFEIDIVYLDRESVVQKVREKVKPWRLLPPVWSAPTAIELAAGRVQELNIRKGDRLNVGD